MTRVIACVGTDENIRHRRHKATMLSKIAVAVYSIPAFYPIRPEIGKTRSNDRRMFTMHIQSCARVGIIAYKNKHICREVSS